MTNRVQELYLSVMARNSSAEGIWRRCRRDATAARLFAAALKGPVESRILLVSPAELFPQLAVSSDGLHLPFMSRGLPYLSHGFESIRRGMAALLYQHGVDPLAVQRRRRALQVTESLKEATEGDARDRLVMAGLQTIRINAPLRELVLGDEPISRPRLREAVKDYSGINCSPIEAAFQDFLPFPRGRRQRKAVGGVARSLDDLLGSFQIEPLKANLVCMSAAHFQKVLRMRGVSQADWRRLLFELTYRQLLIPSSLLYFWCTRCPEAGFVASFTPAYFADSPLCPLCGRVAQAMCTFAPAGYLREAMKLKDGMLGVAVGWFLRKHGFQFKHGLTIGGTELDFIVSGRRGCLLIECKMHHILKPEEHIRSQILASRTQLRTHIHVAQREGLQPKGAACVVNLGSHPLQKTLRRLKAETDLAYQELRAEVISYEDFADWFQRASAATRTDSKPKPIS